MGELADMQIDAALARDQEPGNASPMPRLPATTARQDG